MEEYILIGHTKKTYGARGEIKVNIKDFYLQDFSQTEVVFLPMSGKPVPYFIENINRTGSSLTMKLENIDSPDAAKPLTSKEIQLRQSDLIPEKDRIYEDEQTVPQKYIGFMATDLQEGEIGAIAEIVEMPGQMMAQIQRGGKQILIPFHKSLIHRIDMEERTITFQLPEGILEL